MIGYIIIIIIIIIITKAISYLILTVKKNSL